jgi:hypothetical protein
MAMIDDYTAMYQWDLAAAVLKACVDNGPVFSALADFSSQIMRTGDTTLAAESNLTRLTDMEAALTQTSTNAVNNAFLGEFANLVSSFYKWYVNGTGTGQGSFASINAMFADRHYRIPVNLKDVWLKQQSETITSTYLACAENAVLCTATQGDTPTYVYDEVLDTDMDFAPLMIEAIGNIADANLDVAFTATYSDDSTGAEAEEVASTMDDGDEMIICSNDITGDGAVSGNTVVPMAATSGMVAGQKVLIQDRTWPVALTADCDAALSFTVEDSLPFTPGDVVYLHDDNTANEEATIENITHENKTITLTAATAGTFTTAQNAFMRLTTEDGYGWTECVEIDTVTENTSLEFTDALNHTYSDQAFVQRLIKSIASVAVTNGTTGDSIAITAIPDRPGYTALNA